MLLAGLVVVPSAAVRVAFDNTPFRPPFRLLGTLLLRHAKRISRKERGGQQARKLPIRLAALRDEWQHAIMSVSAAHADAFYVEVLREGEVWGIRDDGGFPAPKNSDGQRAMPFWSLRSRAERVISHVDAYAEFVPEVIPLNVWRERWLAGLEKDGVHVGLNWSGQRAIGFDLPAVDVARNLSARE